MTGLRSNKPSLIIIQSLITDVNIKAFSSYETKALTQSSVTLQGFAFVDLLQEQTWTNILFVVCQIEQTKY